jgi:hypothetical protein
MPVMAERKQVLFRADEKTLDLLRAMGERYGRTMNAEMELAVEAWVHSHALVMYLDPEVIERRGAERVKAERAKTEAALGRLYAEAFSQPDPGRLLAKLTARIAKRRKVPQRG